MKTVLAPIDFSPVSLRVIEQATQIARAIGARLVLLNVVPPPPSLASGLDQADLAARVHLQAETEAAAKLSALQKQLRDDGVTAHVVHHVGQPGPGILEQAERLDADYVVMGSHGHGAFYDLIVGSTTTRVLKQARCAVVIVPPAAKRSQREREAPHKRRAA
jgi:nucleotide-binding universal stress UspA family protein